MNNRFAEFELNSDEDDDCLDDRQSMAGTVHHADDFDIRLTGASTPLIITDLEERADSMDNASIVSACHSSSGSEAERQSVINAEESKHHFYTSSAVRDPPIPAPRKHVQTISNNKTKPKRTTKKVLTKKHIRPKTSTGHQQLSTSHSLWSLAEKQSSISDETPHGSQHGLDGLLSTSPTQHRLFNSKSVIPGIYSQASPRTIDSKTSPTALLPKYSQTVNDTAYQSMRQTPRTSKSMRHSVSSETPWSYTCPETARSKLKELIPLGISTVTNGNMDTSVLMSTQRCLKERSKTFHVMENPLRTQTKARITVLKLPPLENKTPLPGNPSAIINTPT